MFKTPHIEYSGFLFKEQFGTSKVKRKRLDGRRKKDRPPASHPWRQYKLVQSSGRK